MRPGQAVPDHLVAADELHEKPEDGIRPDIDRQRLAGGQPVVAQPSPKYDERERVEDDLVDEGWVQRDPCRHLEARRRHRIEHDPVCRVRRRPGRLGEQAADPPHRHTGRDGGREEIAGADAVADDPLGEMHAEPGAEESAEDGLIAIHPLLGEGGVLAEVDMLQPGAQAHHESAADQRAGHDRDDLVAGAPAPASFEREDQPGDRHAERHEDRVRGHGQVDTQQIPHCRIHAGQSGRPVAG